MNAVVQWLTRLPGPTVYAVVAALVFAEDALFFGFVLPGETAVVVGGVLARQGTVDPWWLAAVVVLAAIAGDSVGYEVGRRFGPPLLRARPLRRHAERVEGARDLIRRRGPVAVFLGRFVAFLRALVPALAGVSHLRYGRFLLFNALGGLVWGVGYVFLGYAAGAAYQRVESLVGRGIAVLLAVLVVGALAVRHFRRHRRDEAPPGAPDAAPPGEGSADRRDGT
ncbi:DedA family protein [Streptomyces sp. MS06]|uniref:DedA family protein n=1 Tax=Streptomyces sp. MS06 TaxID=3385974 RepID=UPI0039A00268